MTKAHPPSRKSASASPTSGKRGSAGPFASAADALRAKIKACAARSFAAQQAGKAPPHGLDRQGLSHHGLLSAAAAQNADLDMPLKGSMPLKGARTRPRQKQWQAGFLGFR
ncbi:MAG TPA: hypothetical protein VGO34_01660 [Alphaproteobacteria bacterium]